VDLPEVVGELPEDLDGDGEADRLLYYRAGEAGAIVMAEVDARGRERLLLFEEPGSRKVAAMVRDLDGDSRYDDVTRFVDGSLAEIQIDQDRDGEPDFLQRFVDGREVHRESKAKKLGMRFRSAQIAQHDVQFGRFGVGRPDAYLQVHKNGELLFRTSAIHDTHFPTWNEGVAVDWRPGDRIDLLMWDQDRDVLWIENKDDFIDSMSIWDRPESGVYDFDRRRASMELRVEPTDRPEGYPLQSEAPPAENIFRDRPWMAPESRDVYLTANRMELQADVTDYLISEIGSQIIVRRILPRAGPTGWIASFAVQQLVFTPLVGEDGLSRSHRDPESGAVIPGQPPAE
jgi:hypothetical protein